jgi:hypothetical protein
MEREGHTCKITLVCRDRLDLGIWLGYYGVEQIQGTSQSNSENGIVDSADWYGIDF